MHSDDKTTVGDLRRAVAEFVAERAWERFHTPKNLAMSISIEAAELMELFQWEPVEQAAKSPDNPEPNSQMADELADILIYCLALANQGDIDLSSAIRNKLSRNEQRYPVGSKPSRAHGL